MKKFINRPEDVVEEMLQGLAVLHPGSARLPGHKALIRADAAQSVISRSPYSPAEAAAMSRRMQATSVQAC
jgi:hypothetical protein